MSSHSTNRRAYINLAESIRVLPITPHAKKCVANTALVQLTGYPDFDADRFRAHALSAHGKK